MRSRNTINIYGGKTGPGGQFDVSDRGELDGIEIMRVDCIIYFDSLLYKFSIPH